MEHRVLMFMAGLGGAIGSTVSVGLSLARSNDSMKIGLVTESPVLKKLELNFPSLNLILIDGWDIEKKDLYTVARKLKICPNDLIDKGKNKLKRIVPRQGFSPEKDIIEDWIKREADYIRSKCNKYKVDGAILVNLCPTEPQSIQCHDDEIDWENMKTIDLETKGVTLSRIYFRLAIEAGTHFVNYTPNIAETETLRRLAEERGIIYCGRDGKTGQTFIKTVIAPALRDKNFKVEGWFSTNILGNNDGLTLSHKDSMLTKKLSKSECLGSILGYAPGDDPDHCHQVHIHYYPPRGDAKEAWDNIDFTGFLGKRMQMKINWLGQDSILAAPAIIDLVRIVSIAADNDHVGLLEQSGYFFKSPLTENEHTPQHAVPGQFKLLVEYLSNYRNDIQKSPYKNIINFLSGYYNGKKTCLSLRPSEIKMSHASAVVMANRFHSEYILVNKNSNRKERCTIGHPQNLQYIRDLCEAELKYALDARYVSLQPSSGLNAADIVLNSYCSPGDSVFLVPEEYGGYSIIADLAKSMSLNVEYIPFDENRNIQWNVFKRKIIDLKPSMVYFDLEDSTELYSFEELDVSENDQTVFVYDISPILGLVIGEAVKNPLNERFDVVIGSSNQSFPGPHQGLCASNNKYLFEKFQASCKKRINEIDPHRLLSLAVALIEFREYGHEFARQVIENANTLGKALKQSGFQVVEKNGCYSTTHKLWIRFNRSKPPDSSLRKLQEAGIFVELKKLPFSLGWGIELGVLEPTLAGCEENEMAGIAQLISDVFHTDIPPSTLSGKLKFLLRKSSPIWKAPDFAISLLKHYSMET